MGATGPALIVRGVPSFTAVGEKTPSPMVTATDFTGKAPVADADKKTSAKPKRPRFRLLAALAAPFKDVDDRAVKTRRAPKRNISKGNLFASGVAAPAKVAVKRFPRGGD